MEGSVVSPRQGPGAPREHAPPRPSTLRKYYPLGTKERHMLDTQLASMRQAELEERQQQEAMRNCFFRPLIHKRASLSAASTDSADESMRGSTGGGPVFDRLREQAKAREERRQRREEERKQQEAAERRQSFRPAINRHTPFDAQVEHLEQLPVEERLLGYGEAVTRSLEHRRAQQELEEAERGQSQKNRTAPADPEERAKARKAFHERNARLLLQREVSRQLAEKEAADALRFRPTISATSAAIDDVLRHRVGLTTTAPNASLSQSSPSTSVRRDRGILLYAQAVENQRRRAEQRLHEGDPSQDGGPSGAGMHQPRTNPLSEDWIAHSEHQSLFERDFVSRQAIYEEARQHELRALAEQHRRREEAERGLCGLSSGGKAGGAGLPPPPATRADVDRQVRRLYYAPLEAARKPGGRQSEHVREALAAECPFKPELSQGTRQVMRQLAHRRERDVVRRLAVPARRATASVESEPSPRGAAPSTPARELSARTSATKDPGETPTPRWNSSPAKPTSPGWAPAASHTAAAASPGDAPVPAARPQTAEEVERFYERQLASLRVREERRKLLQQQRVAAELAECTFQPRTVAHSGGTRPADEAASVEARVSGVQQYLQRQAAAKQRKEELAERLRTMGMPSSRGPTTGAAGGQPLVCPFELQTDQRARRRAEHVQGGSPAREGGRTHEVSLFALDTVERERLLELEREALIQNEGSSAYTKFDDAWRVSGEAAQDEDTDDETGVESAGGAKAFEAHHTAAEAVACGGEACIPRGRSPSQRSQVPVAVRPVLRPPQPCRRSSLLLRQSGAPRERSRDSRSVSFVGVPSSPRKPSRDGHSDPYSQESLLARLHA